MAQKKGHTVTRVIELLFEMLTTPTKALDDEMLKKMTQKKSVVFL